jgi:predicted metal-dependent hydrolase
MTKITYYVKRSRRKTVGLEVTKDLQVIVRAPLKMSNREIERLVEKHTDWILKSLSRLRNASIARYEPTEEEIEDLIKRAKEMLPQKVQYYGFLMGCMPGRITITSARTRFGSCSVQNNICFSWRLMLYPEEAIDYVVVHELAHIKYKNHGMEFYKLIESILPDYKKRKALLKK